MLSKMLGLVACALALQQQVGAQSLSDFTPEELAVIQGMRDTERVRRAPGGPSISTKNGDVTLTVGKDNAINFQVGSKTVDATAIPDALRGYTDATVAATQLGFDQGLAQGTAQGKVYALEVKTELTSELAKIQQSMSDLVTKSKADAIVAAKTMKEAKEANDKAAKEQKEAAAKLAKTLTADLTAGLALAEPKQKGRKKADPMADCMQMDESNFYWVKPPSPYKGDAFEVWCDGRWGGGWMMIVHGAGWEYKKTWTPGNARKAVGGVPSPNRKKATGALSKLSDVQINGYLAMTGAKFEKNVYRIESECGGPGRNYMQSTSAGWGIFIESSQKKYDDNKNGMGIISRTDNVRKPKYAYGWNPGKVSTPKWWNSGTFDLPHSSGHWQGSTSDRSNRPENDCWRFFQGHRGNPATQPFMCYKAYSGPTTDERCFNLGSDCRCHGQGGHPQAWGIEFYVKKAIDYTNGIGYN